MFTYLDLCLGPSDGFSIFSISHVVMMVLNQPTNDKVVIFAFIPDKRRVACAAHHSLMHFNSVVEISDHKVIAHLFDHNGIHWHLNQYYILMGWYKTGVTSLLTYWRYVFLASTHRYIAINFGGLLCRVNIGCHTVSSHYECVPWVPFVP